MINIENVSQTFVKRNITIPLAMKLLEMPSESRIHFRPEQFINLSYQYQLMSTLNPLNSEMDG